jgi:hypothetical protein
MGTYEKPGLPLVGELKPLGLSLIRSHDEIWSPKSYVLCRVVAVIMISIYYLCPLSIIFIIIDTPILFRWHSRRVITDIPNCVFQCELVSTDFCASFLVFAVLTDLCMNGLPYHVYDMSIWMEV